MENKCSIDQLNNLLIKNRLILPKISEKEFWAEN
jgi:hypothetical protein